MRLGEGEDAFPTSTLYSTIGPLLLLLLLLLVIVEGQQLLLRADEEEGETLMGEQGYIGFAFDLYYNIIITTTTTTTTCYLFVGRLYLCLL